MNTNSESKSRAIKRFLSKGWRTSRQGNLWRDFHELFLCVYRVRSGDYQWQVHLDCLHRVHGERFESEKSAMKDLAKKLFDGRKFRKAYIQLKQCEPPW